MKIGFITLALALTTSVTAQARTFDFTFRNQPMSKVVELYAKESGKEIIFTPAVDPKITILTKQEVNVDKAFELLSAALAEAGLTFVKKSDVYVVTLARSAQRSSLEVVTKLPPMIPERMISYVHVLKHAKADQVNKNLRILPSKDGELVPYPETNQIIITDWISNVYRVRDTLVAIDQPTK